MPKKLYTSVPPRYEVCLHADCPKADVCLHQIAYQKLLSEQTFLHIINPKMCKKKRSLSILSQQYSHEVC